MRKIAIRPLASEAAQAQAIVAASAPELDAVLDALTAATPRGRAFALSDTPLRFPGLVQRRLFRADRDRG